MIIELYALKCFALGVAITFYLMKRFYRVKPTTYEIKSFANIKRYFVFVSVVLALDVSAQVVTVTDFVSHTSVEKTRNHKAASKVDETIKSDCFKNFILERKLNTTNGKSNKEVLEHLQTSKVSITLIMYRERLSKTVGYTYPNQMKIWMNRKYHDAYSACNVAANLGHEFAHKIKYDHSMNYTKERDFTVPYSVGSGINKCCR